jgi:ADP-ribose pyrophosphatase
VEPKSVRKVFEGHLISVEVQSWATGEREVVHHPGACGVVALTESGEVLLVRQMREAVREALLEIPAGILDKEGEDAAGCAARELLDETGHRAVGIEPLATIYTSPGFADERIQLFLAEVADGDPEGQGEDGVEVVRMPLGEAIADIERGIIKDAKSVAALLLAFHRDRPSGEHGSGAIEHASKRRP